MPYTIATALDEPSISHAAQLQSEFTVQVGDLGPQVRFRVWRLIKGVGFYFTQSHYIHTPLQAGPYRTNATYAESEADALHLAGQTLHRFYDDAVRAGKVPAEDWLVTNEHF